MVSSVLRHLLGKPKGPLCSQFIVLCPVTQVQVGNTWNKGFICKKATSINNAYRTIDIWWSILQTETKFRKKTFSEKELKRKWLLSQNPSYNQVLHPAKNIKGLQQSQLRQHECIFWHHNEELRNENECYTKSTKKIFSATFLVISQKQRNEIYKGWKCLQASGLVNIDLSATSTFEIVRAGLQPSFRISRLTLPAESTLQW